MTPSEILAEARRWNVDISPSDARILNFASWVRAMALEEVAQLLCDAKQFDAYEIVYRILKDQPCSK